MIHIALCDDRKEQCELTQSLLNDYIALRDISAKIWVFSSGKQLLCACEDQQFDIYILDVLMPGMNGIELGKIIHNRIRTGNIIYLTTSPDYALESFDAKASSYLLKPVNSKRFFAVLDDTISQLEKQQKQNILIKTTDAVHCVSLDDILYVELCSRIPHYHLADGNTIKGLTVRSSFRETIKGLLQDMRFFPCGASYVLNLHHIKSISKTEVLLSNEQQISIPRRVHIELLNAWTDYWLEGEKFHYES